MVSTGFLEDPGLDLVQIEHAATVEAMSFIAPSDTWFVAEDISPVTWFAMRAALIPGYIEPRLPGSSLVCGTCGDASELLEFGGAQPWKFPFHEFTFECFENPAPRDCPAGGKPHICTIGLTSAGQDTNVRPRLDMSRETFANAMTRYLPKLEGASGMQAAARGADAGA